MAQEKKEGMLAKLDTKQKVIAGIFVIIVIVIIWQVASLFGGETTTPTPVSTPAPATAPVAQNISGAAPAASPTTPVANTANTNAMTEPPPQPAIPQMKEVPVPVDTSILELEKQSQKKYLDSLNQLQLLKIQRDIAETNQAIATAKLATVTAEKSVSDLLTKPVPTPGAYSNMLVNPTQQGLATLPTGETQPVPTTTPPTQPSTPAPPPPAPEISYSVISVSMQMGKWTAVIGFQGQLYSVSIGDTLPPDKSVVSAINRNSVVLEKDGKKRKIDIVSTI